LSSGYRGAIPGGSRLVCLTRSLADWFLHRDERPVGGRAPLTGGAPLLSDGDKAVARPVLDVADLGHRRETELRDVALTGHALGGAQNHRSAPLALVRAPNRHHAQVQRVRLVPY